MGRLASQEGFRPSKGSIREGIRITLKVLPVGRIEIPKGEGAEFPIWNWSVRRRSTSTSTSTSTSASRTKY